MVKVMMYGCNGYMGHVICNLIKDMENVTVAAGIDPCPGDQKDFPVFTQPLILRDFAGRLLTKPELTRNPFMHMHWVSMARARWFPGLR